VDIRKLNTGFIQVLGDSHVRAFARHTAFLPLFIGSGKETCFVTKAHAAATRERLLANLERLAPCPVLLVFGEPDVRLHLENAHGTREAGAASDAPQMEAAVTRYAALLDEVRLRHAAPIAVLSSSPTPRAGHNQLARLFNARLSAACAARGIPLLDLWPDVIPPGSEVVDPSFSADHVHLGEQIVRPLARHLHALGWLPPEFDPTPDFEWSYLYRFPVGTRETRVWGDANVGSAGHQRKFGRTEAIAACGQKIASVLDRADARSVLVAEAREGFVAFQLPPLPRRRIAAWEADPARTEAGKRLRAFARRDDITMYCGDWRTAEPADVVIALEPSAAPLAEAARLARVGVFFLGLDADMERWPHVERFPIGGVELVWAGRAATGGWRQRLRQLMPT
jgi:lysophospholipase L1-like esterase